MGVYEAEQHASELIQLKDELIPELAKQGSTAARVLKAGALRAGAAGVGATIGAFSSPHNRVAGAAEGALAGGVLSSPAVASKLAMLMADPRYSMMIGQLLRPAGSALNQ
jgi:hypothetical protein